MRPPRLLLFTGIIGFILLVGWSELCSAACTACRCGDNLFFTSANRLGSEGSLGSGKLLITFQQQYISKSSAFVDHSAHTGHSAPSLASSAVEEGFSSLTEHRFATRLSYDLTRDFSAAAEVPFSSKRFESLNEGIRRWERASGFGDIELSLAYSPVISRLRWSRWSAHLSVLAKLPTGQDQASKANDILTHQVQPGTGSLDWQWGGALLYSREVWSSYASLYYRLTGTNEIDYRMGSAFLFNLGLQRALGNRVAISLQANGRVAERDNHNGVAVEHTGGTVVFVTPGARYQLMRALSLYANLQIPTIERLNDIQNEKLSLAGGIGVGL